jgi:ectoine hydroxylase
MSILSRIFQKQTGWLRSLKLSYVLNNLLHGKQLARNKELYTKYGVKKSIYAPIGSADFHDTEHKTTPWLDQADALDRLVEHPDFQQFSTVVQSELRRFVKDGYMVFNDFVSDTAINQLNAEVDEYIKGGTVDFNYTGRKIVDLHSTSVLAKEQFFKNPELLRLFKFILQKDILPFQSLNFIQGSEQRVHSDSIHMMTEPPGFMIAAWYALEDCTDQNGPLVYYPGSHRLTYVTTLDYPSGNTALTIGAESNKRYEAHIARLVEEKQLKPAFFHASKGSVLIWHANLLHGGSPIKKPGTTRKSMVCHYYASEVICYHEMSQRPAILPPV